MLRVRAAEHLDTLADHLAAELSTPSADPMAAEWIVVTSAGTQRWLRLALARRLGARPGHDDGVAANLDLLYPGSFTRRVVTPDTPGDILDPWAIGPLTWAVLTTLAERTDDPVLGPVATVPAGATLWGRARRIADLFDRYLTHRPAMVRSWTAGADVGGGGAPLPETHRWQPRLWRAVHAQLGTPSPAELLPARLEALRAGAGVGVIPHRVTLFGLTSIPGGAPFLDLLEALAPQHDIVLLSLQPSLALRAGLEPAHPLLRSWARPALDTRTLLASRSIPVAPLAAAAEAPAGSAEAVTPPEVPTLLGALQAAIRSNTAPEPTFTPDPADDSVRIHVCHGQTRQVEVLRDQLLHLLTDDPTLREDDIVVLCPDLATMAPLIEAVLGPSAPSGADGAGGPARAGGPPTLSYRLTDRTLRDSAPMLRALDDLLALLSGRCPVDAVLDFAGLAPVRERFRFDDESLAQLAHWVESTNTRWGLDGDHRRRWGIPPGHRDGAWATTLDRMLLGATTSELVGTLGVGDTLVCPVDDTDLGVVGGFAAIITALRELTVAGADSRPLDDWLPILRDAADRLFAAPRNEDWQRSALDRTLAELATTASAAIGDLDAPDRPRLSLAEVHQIVGEHLSGGIGRSEFFRGGVTFCSVAPLRAVPFRVVCLLGADAHAFGAPSPDSDDLLAADPQPGDLDSRSERRQMLLDAVLAAGEHLIICRTGHNVITNQPVPPAVPVVELHDVVAAGLHPDVREAAMRRIEVVHTRQAFDERNFVVAADSSAGRPWSFDPIARDAALARRRRIEPPTLLGCRIDVATPEVIDLADLADFLAHPIRHFVRRVLQVWLPKKPEGRRSTPVTVGAPLGAGGGRRPSAADGVNLVLELDPLEAWEVRDRLLTHLRAGLDPRAFDRIERARATLPPGELGAARLAESHTAIAALLDTAAANGLVPGTAPAPCAIDCELADGTRLLGAVLDDGGVRPGPIRIAASKYKPQVTLASWLDVSALCATDPTVDWRAVSVNPPVKTNAGPFVQWSGYPGDAEQRRAAAMASLTVAVDLYRRGRCEPLPLFPKLSPALAGRGAVRDAWSPFGGTGDGDDQWVQFAFDHPTLEQVRSLEVLVHDPPGDGDDRATRYATYLWSAVLRSELAGDQAAEAAGDEVRP